MSDIRAYVANFIGKGHEITKYKDDWLRDSLSFNCDGFIFKFIQNRVIITGKLDNIKGQFLESTEVLIKNVKKNDVRKVLSILDRICWLLSFAGLCRVLCYGHEYPDGSGLKKFSSVVGEVNYFRPSIDICDGNQTIEYIQTCYNAYKQLERIRKLNVVIDYLVQAERPGQPTELKLIICFVVLENLKDTYARSMGIPYKKGYYRKVPKPNKGDDHYSFEELLNLMLRQVRMKKSLKRIRDLRNEIIHSGVTRKPYSWQWKKYEGLHDLLREYILRLMGYSGHYLTYTSESVEIKKL